MIELRLTGEKAVLFLQDAKFQRMVVTTVKENSHGRWGVIYVNGLVACSISPMNGIRYHKGTKTEFTPP